MVGGNSDWLSIGAFWMPRVTSSSFASNSRKALVVATADSGRVGTGTSVGVGVARAGVVCGFAGDCSWSTATAPTLTNTAAAMIHRLYGGFPAAAGMGGGG